MIDTTAKAPARTSLCDTCGDNGRAGPFRPHPFPQVGERMVHFTVHQARHQVALEARLAQVLVERFSGALVVQ